MNSLYGDRNSLNASQPEAENNSLSAPPQPWPAPLNPSSEHYPEEQSSVPFYNPATNTSYYCAQPAQPQTEAWPSWPNESNNNNPSIFQPQNQPLNPQADPWQWSVDQSAESTNWGSSQGLPPIPLEQSQPSYEQYPTQQIPEMGYYYGQPSTEQWDYSKQQLGYESTDTNASWNSWNQPNEPVWNPVSPDDQNHSIKGEPNATLPIVSQQVPDIEPIVSQSVEPVFENHTITRVTDVVEESLSQEYSIPPDSTTNALPYAVESQADEPNQEVPEPVKSELQSMSPVHNSSIKLEKLETSSPPLPKDPPNEQIPFKPDSPISGMAVSAEVPSKNVVIKPWDGGPFQPPANRLPNSEVVQREIPETVDSVTSSLSKLEINTEPEISANMESEPDNLEQPPDPSVNRVNPHHVALHKEHFAEELDSEASKTNLWEQPNLPNVLFLPATLSDNLSRSGSPALNPAPPTIPVSIPFNESVISNASPPHLADNSKTMGRNDNPLNLVELDKSPVRRRPETFDRADSKSSISKSNTERVQSTEKILPQSSAPVAEMETRNSQDRRSRDSQDKDIDDRDKNLKSYRYREMEDIDSHYDNRNQYNNDRYYYNDRRERVSRPSSRASEPAGNHYSSRYNHSRDFDPNGALLPAREGTPSRIIMSEDDLRRDRHSNEYRDLRGSKSDLRDFRDSRDMIDSLNSRDPSYHKSRDPRDIRDPRGQDYGEDGRNRGKEDYPDSRGYEDDLRRDRRSNEYRNLRGSKSDLRDVRDPRDRRDPLDSREPRDPRDRRDPLDSREPRDPRDRRDPFDSREPRDPRDRRDPLDSRELRDPSYSRDHRSRDPRDIREPRGQDYAEDGRNRGREDYTDTRGYKEDRRQQHTRGGEEDYYNRNRGYNKNGNYGYDYYRQPDPYSMYYNYYNYPMNYNYGYYDELYRSNPKYREQVDNYRAYYSQMGYDSDRMSSHSRSGRSSVNDEISKDSSRFQKDYDTGSEYSGYQPSLTLDNSYNQPDSRDDSVASHITPARLTPAKFSCPHIISKLTPGKLLTSTINNTSLQIHDMQQILSFDNTIENFKLYPGPLLNEQTHKNDVIQFCQLKITTFQCNIEIPDRDSQVLLWELLVLMLRQNGNVSGSDVAELLLKDRHVTKTTNPSLMRQASAAGSSSSPSEDALELPTLLTTSSDGHLIVNDSATPSPDEGIVVSQDSRVNGGTNNSTINSSRKEILSTDQITEKFTEYLLCGHKKDALEWASKHGLWGHALFLASKMDSRSYAYIMTRFANSLPLNDPLQTLYQLMSGRQPYAVTRLVDEKFGDWRVHLAMILSNLSSNIEVDCRSMTTLGDTLAQRGCLSAAHFCYLMSQINFGRYEQKSSKLVLLTSSHTLPFAEFASNEAIQCTEIYEYARSLASPGFVLPHLQPYKLLYASRLAEYGLLQESLHYCEVMTSMAKNSRSSFSTSLLLGMSEIVWKLKYHDPHYTQAQGELEDIADPEWITQLFSMAKDTICNPVENNSYIEETYTQDTTLAPSHSNETEGSWVNNSEPTGQPQPQLFNPQPVNTDWSMNQNAYNQPSFMGSYGQPEPQESMANASQNATDETNSNSQLLGSNTYNSDSPTLTSTTKSSFDYYGSATTQFQERSEAPLPTSLPPPPTFELTTQVTARSSPCSPEMNTPTITTPPPSPSSPPPPLPPRPQNSIQDITSSHERLLIQLCRESDSDFGDGSSAHSSPAKRSTLAESDDDDTHALVPISNKSLRPRSPTGASGWLKSTKLKEKDKIKNTRSPEQTSPKDFSKTMARFQGVLRRRKFSTKKNEPSFTDSSPDWSPRHKRDKAKEEQLDIGKISLKSSTASLNVFGMLSSKKFFGKDNFPWKNHKRRHKAHGSTGSLPTANSEAESDNSAVIKGILHTCNSKDMIPLKVENDSKKKYKKTGGRKPGTGSKPVVFGGTYPIDEPCLLQDGLPFLSESLLSSRWSAAQNSSTLPSFNGRNRLKRYQHTFPVDIPCSSESNMFVENLKRTDELEDSLDEEVAKWTAEGCSNLHLKVIKKQHLKKTMKHQSNSLDEASSPWISPKKKEATVGTKKVSFKCVEVLSDSEIINRTSLQPCKSGRRPPLQGRERQDSVGSLGYARRDSSFSNTSVNSAVNSANSNSSPTSKPSISKDNSSSNAMKKEMKGKPQSGGSWFGKLFGNFLPKGPNQMILPDDKNPSIVWDAKNSKWMNTYDDDSNSTEAAPMAPPKDSELKPPSFASPPSFNNIGSSPVGPPSIPSTGINRFQRPKFKNMRQNYVDVLNVNNSNSAAGATQFQNSAALPPNDPMFQKIDQPTQIPNFFIPAPAPNNDAPGDFVTQGHIPVPSEGVSDSTTPMFDPAEFSTAPKVAGDLGQKRSIGGYNLASRRAYPS